MTVAPPTSRRVEVSLLSDQLERGFRGGAWHGPALEEALDGIDGSTAAANPVVGAHSIWEIAGHAAAWMGVARRRIAGEGVVQLPPEESWPRPSEPSDEAWTAVRRGLERAYQELQATLQDLDDARLDDPVAGSDPTVRGMLLGVIQHNAYHAGQVVLLARAGGRP